MVLRMLQEVCEHLDLRQTIKSRKFLELVKLGFVESSCRWRVEKVTPTTISIVPRDPDLKPFTMKREHWL